jgi:hypothetical protein
MPFRKTTQRKAAIGAPFGASVIAPVIRPSGIFRFAAFGSEHFSETAAHKSHYGALYSAVKHEANDVGWKRQEMAHCGAAVPAKANDKEPSLALCPYLDCILMRIL